MNTEILVIEDDDLVRQGIVDILELKGWNAVAAKSCSECSSAAVYKVMARRGSLTRAKK